MMSATPPPPISSAPTDPNGGGDGGGYLAGRLLVAMPNQTWPPFATSVIYLCSHSADGAMGLIVNQPLQSPSFVEVMRQLKIDRDDRAGRCLPVLAGGPVQVGRGFVLHSGDWQGDSTLHLAGAMALTTSLDVLKAVAVGSGPVQALMALGYAGWGAGQLEREIAGNSWLCIDADPALIFEGDYAARWRQALATLRIDPLLLSTTAGHA